MELTEFEIGYAVCAIDLQASYCIHYNKVNEIRGTYDPTIQICVKNKLVFDHVSRCLKLLEIAHSVKTYTSYRLIVITSIYTINRFFEQIGSHLHSTPRMEILKEFVELRVSKNLTNAKSRYGDEEVALWRKMKMLGKKTEFVKAERIDTF